MLLEILRLTSQLASEVTEDPTHKYLEHRPRRRKKLAEDEEVRLQSGAGAGAGTGGVGG